MTQESEKNLEKSLEKKESLVYRFTNLIHAIDFFSMRFDIEQIVEYAVNFANDLLHVDKHVVLVNKAGFYVPQKHKNFQNREYSIKVVEQLEHVVMFHAGLFYKEDLIKYFPKSLLENYPASMGIPLVMDKVLYGIILVDKEQGQAFDSDDTIIGTALMNLYYTALTNHASYNQLIEVKKELDEKIFNLFAINQSSKALLSTLKLEDIFQLSTSVFSELTQSSITGLFIFDDVSEKYTLKAYQNVYHLKADVSLVLYTREAEFKCDQRVYLDMKNYEERFIFESQFFNGKELIELTTPEYIVMIRGASHIRGFITLSKKVNGMPYLGSILELIESLASSLYISIENAYYLEKIEQQKKLLDNKLGRMMTLNALMKNLNSSKNLEQLLEILSDTLRISFKVDRGLIAAYDQSTGCFYTQTSIGSDFGALAFDIHYKKTDLLRGEVVVASSILEAEELIDEKLIKVMAGEFAGALMIPLYLDQHDLQLLGVLMIFNVQDKVISDEENMITFETIGNQVAPIWYQLTQIKGIQESYTPNYSQRFIKDIEVEMEEAREYGLELYVFFIQGPRHFTWQETKLSETITKNFKKIYPIAYDRTFVMTGIESDVEIIEALVAEGYHFRRFTYLEDFEDLKTLEILVDKSVFDLL